MEAILLIGLTVWAMNSLQRRAKERRAREMAACGTTPEMQKALYELWMK